MSKDTNMQICPECRNLGWLMHNPPCPTCSGTGKIPASTPDSVTTAPGGEELDIVDLLLSIKVTGFRWREGDGEKPQVDMDYTEFNKILDAYIARTGQERETAERAKEKRDLEFLREMKKRLTSDDDIVSQEYALQMVNDWIYELEATLRAEQAEGRVE